VSIRCRPSRRFVRCDLSRLALPLALLASIAFPTPAPAQFQFRRGDVNLDGALDVADPVLLLAALFSGGTIACDSAADANDDGAIDIADPVRLLEHLFAGGSALPAPFPGCGSDPTPDGLDCAGGGGCPPLVPPDQPLLLSVLPAFVQAGDLVTLQGFNFSAHPASNRVEFADSAGGVRLAATVESVTLGAPTPGSPTPATLVARVPSGVRGGAVSLETVETDGSDIDAGSVPIAAAPVLTGYAIGDDGQMGAVLRDAVLTIYPASVQLFGHDLAGVTSVTIDDGIQTVSAPAVTPGLHPGATYAIPSGLEALTVALPGGLLPDGCTTAKLRFRAHAPIPAGGTFSTPPVEIPFAYIDIASSAVSDIPLSASGWLFPAGVRSGEIEFECVYFHEDPLGFWDLAIEYQDPADASGSTWLPCTITTATLSLGLIGGQIETGANPGIVGPGSADRFTWHTAVDLPAGSGPVVTRVRVRPLGTFPSGASPSEACAGVVTSARIVIDNDGAASGSIREEFADDDQLDPASTALWNDGGSGILTAVPAIAAPVWGSGVADLLLAAGSSYVIDTDLATVTDVSVPGSPVDLLPGQPGSALGEFHLRSIVLEAGAEVSVVGDRPLVIRCAGDGSSAFVAARIDGEFDLRGANGTVATVTAAGVGGAGGPGGGDGGDGGWIAADINSQTVTDLVPAESGELRGGEAGPSITAGGFPFTAIWLPRAGPGGGGGHAARGETGVLTYSATVNPNRGRGEGGLPHGDAAITTLRGGSGGGGGGATSIRLTTPTSFIAKHGGGGGGGGGALAIHARGTMHVGGTIDARGGNGAKGSSGNQSGPGGGGAGGAILLRATGDLEFATGAELRASGGFGAVTQVSTGGMHRGGNGALGRIRLEANGTLQNPGIGEFAAVEPPMGSPGVTNGPAAGPFETGSGIDGALDAGVLGTTGTLHVDTGLGRITAPGGALLFANASGTGLFELTTLDLPAGITLVAEGPNPLILLVAGNADLRGTIELSGAAGGIPDHTDPFAPLPGSGGAAGAGGGAGGVGGSSTGSTATAGGFGGLPPTLPIQLVVGLPPGGGSPVPFEPIVPAIPGTPALTAGSCAGGSGGGGGYAQTGVNGQTIPGCPAAGAGGSAYGSNFFLVPDPNDPLQSIPLRVGGSGGAGGGGAVAGFSPRAPGSGGGGAGGYLLVEAGGVMTVHGSCRILARGGDAYVASAAGGAGGGGAGGGVQLRGAARVDFLAGAVVDVRGGTANLDPADAGLSPTYTPAVWSFAGDGASGRIRIESALGFTATGDIVIDPPPTQDLFRTAGLAESVAITLPYPVRTDAGAVPGDAAFLPLVIELASPLPAGTHVVALLEGAFPDPADPARTGEFFGLVDDPSLLDGVEWIRLVIHLYSSASSAPEIERIELPFD